MNLAILQTLTSATTLTKLIGSDPPGQFADLDFWSQAQQKLTGSTAVLELRSRVKNLLPTVGKIWRTDSRFLMLLDHCTGVGFVNTCS